VGSLCPGPPLVRGVVLPAGDWQIEDTWHAAGLKGTGSHHIVLKNAVAPEASFLDLVGGTPCVPGPLYGIPAYLIPLLHGAFDLGVAEGALDALIALANTGRQQLRAVVPMCESESFHGELGRIEADLKAARAFHQVQVASHWRHALAGTLAGPALMMQGTQAAIWIATACVRVADVCFRLGGGSAVYESSPLQWRLRDLQTSAQHAAVQQHQYANAGKLLLDIAP
jgi:indole-3-acetate monooxygenase